jgi:hypothetical protein
MAVRGFGVWVLALSIGCGDPSPAPSVYDDPILAAQIAEHDGLDDVQARYGGFVHGEEAYYWGIGRASPETMPLYQLCARTETEDCAPIDHPPIVDLLPGDEGYSHFGRIHQVRVLPSWRGRLTSVEEIDAAVTRGDAQPPIATQRYLHCPIAAPEAELDVGDSASVTPDTRIYVRGMEARCFDFTPPSGPGLLDLDGLMIVRNVYVLRRESETAPLHEAMRMEDLTGDGDMVDSNNVLGVGLADSDYTPLWRVVRVTVPDTYGSIDTYQDEERADYTSASDMFDIAPDYTITPIEGRVLEYEMTDVVFDCPLQSAEGSI